MTTEQHQGFESITIDMATGRIAYPDPGNGFKLDHERMYASAARFAQFCGSTEQAVRHAIWEQISAHRGMAQLRRAAGC